MKTVQITFTGSVSQIRTGGIPCQSTQGHVRTHALRPLHVSLPLHFEELGPRPLVGAVRRPGCLQTRDTRLICFLPSSEGFSGGSVVKNLPAKQETWVAWLERSPGEGNGNPVQCSCLKNPMDDGTWWAIVHGAAKSRTRLRDETTMTTTCVLKKKERSREGLLGENSCTGIKGT